MHTHAAHHRADAISSMAAVVAILGTKMGWYFLDALVAVFEACHLLFLSGEILTHSVPMLLDHALDEDTKTSISEIVTKVAGQETAGQINARYIGRFVNVDLHLKLPETLRMDEVEKVAERIRFALKGRVRHLGNVNVIYE
jgi:divalent metal cation (Fe/Co/Zn/Cd) transporter